jgi:hypothetical protein
LKFEVRPDIRPSLTQCLFGNSTVGNAVGQSAVGNAGGFALQQTFSFHSVFPLESDADLTLGASRRRRTSRRAIRGSASGTSSPRASTRPR